VMAYLRYDSTNVVLVLLNISTDIQKISCKHDLIIGTFTNIFSGLQFSFNNEEAFELMPGDYLVYVK